MVFLMRALAVAACCVSASSSGLTIVPVFDSTISDDAANGPAMEAAINAAIHVFETNYLDDFTLNITFEVDTNVGLGESSVDFVLVDYTKFRDALISNATSVNDMRALSHLPATLNDPVIGGEQMTISVVLAKKLKLTSQTPIGNTIYFNTNIMNFTRPNPNNQNFDMQSVAEHEIDEVMGGGGSGCTAGAFPQIGATDLFRYATNSTNALVKRTWTTTGDNAYFSVDGTNLWARFSMTPGSDLGDFWGVNFSDVTYLPLYWTPPGVTPHAQVQNAFATPAYFSFPANFEDYPTTNYYYENTSPDLSTNELTMLDVIGWTLAGKASTPSITLVVSKTNEISLYWNTNVAGYKLEETTNLSTGPWVEAATGTKSPAVITISNSQTFYRLENPNPEPAVVQAPSSPEEPVSSAPPTTRRLRLALRPPLPNDSY
jgi:hypothetical protein